MNDKLKSKVKALISLMENNVSSKWDFELEYYFESFSYNIG